MISIVTPVGKFKVWTKRFGNNPTIKVLLLHGGPGGTHEFFDKVGITPQKPGVAIAALPKVNRDVSVPSKCRWITARGSVTINSNHEGNPMSVHTIPATDIPNDDILYEVVNGQIVVQRTAPLFLRMDHRFVHSHQIAKFLNTLCGYLTEPSRLVEADSPNTEVHSAAA